MVGAKLPQKLVVANQNKLQEVDSSQEMAELTSLGEIGGVL